MELVLGKTGTEEGKAVAVGVGDCATRSAGVKMGTLKDKAADSGPGQKMVNWRSLVLDLLLAVVIGLAYCYCYAANAAVVEFFGAPGKE